MNNTFEDLPVGEIVANNPKAAEVFIRLNVDFCCGGKRSFIEVCQKQGVDPHEVWGEIEKISQGSKPSLDFKNFEVDFFD